MDAIQKMFFGLSNTPTSISTGFYELDKTTGVNGFPSKSIIEISGPPGVAKTSLSLAITKNYQMANKLVVYFDIEKTLNLDYLKRLRIDLTKLIVCYPDTIDMAISMVKDYIDLGVDLIIFDSVAAFVTERELKSKLSYYNATELNSKIRSLVTQCSYFNEQCDTVVLFLNQNRRLFNVNYAMSEVSVGDRVFNDLAHIRYKASSSFTQQGNYVFLNVRSNKLSYNYQKTAVFDFVHGHGVSQEYDTIKEAIEFGVLVTNGNWISYPPLLNVNGKTQCINALRVNPRLHFHIKQEIDKVKSSL